MKKQMEPEDRPVQPGHVRRNSRVVSIADAVYNYSAESSEFLTREIRVARNKYRQNKSFNDRSERASIQLKIIQSVRRASRVAILPPPRLHFVPVGHLVGGPANGRPAFRGRNFISGVAGSATGLRLVGPRNMKAESIVIPSRR